MWTFRNVDLRAHTRSVRVIVTVQQTAFEVGDHQERLLVHLTVTEEGTGKVISHEPTFVRVAEEQVSREKPLP